MAELLQPETEADAEGGLSDAERELNKLRQRRMEAQTSYENRVRIHLGKIAALDGPGVVSSRDSYHLRDLARAEVEFMQPEKHA